MVGIQLLCINQLKKMITQADYQENSMIDKYIKALINKIEADYTLKKLEKKDN